MNRKFFLAFIILVIVAISAVATISPIATFGIAVCSLPFVLTACYLTTPDRLKNKERKIIKKTN
jgi:starvation-inducible outer membrane lipoprotein